MNFNNVTEGVVFCSFLEQTYYIDFITIHQKILDERLEELEKLLKEIKEKNI